MRPVCLKKIKQTHINKTVILKYMYTYAPSNGCRHFGHNVGIFDIICRFIIPYSTNSFVRFSFLMSSIFYINTITVNLHMRKFKCDVIINIIIVRVNQNMTYIINDIRTTCWLVKRSISSFIEPISDGVKQNRLMCQFVVQYFKSFIIIGKAGAHLMTWTNQEWW